MTVLNRHTVNRKEHNMFNNTVFKANVNTAKWFKAAGVRMLKTAAQTAIATIGTATMVSEVNWTAVLSTVVVATCLSFFTSVAGIPEVSEE